MAHDRSADGNGEPRAPRPWIRRRGPASPRDVHVEPARRWCRACGAAIPHLLAVRGGACPACEAPIPPAADPLPPHRELAALLLPALLNALLPIVLLVLPARLMELTAQAPEGMPFRAARAVASTGRALVVPLIPATFILPFPLLVVLVVQRGFDRPLRSAARLLVQSWAPGVVVVLVVWVLLA